MRNQGNLSIGLIAVVLASAGCKDDANEAATGGRDAAVTSAHDAGKTKDAGATGSDEGAIVGSFTMTLIAPTASVEGHTQLIGKVYDAVTPEQIVWEEALATNGCRLLTPRVPFCSEPCGGSAVCAEDESCVPYPSAHSVGTITVKGVKTSAGATQFTIAPIANGYQPTGGISLPFPAFDEGDNVQIVAPGGEFSAFTLNAHGIAPLELGDTELGLSRGQPLALRWTAPDKNHDARISVRLDISHHGGSKGKIECDVDDDGELDISAEMIGKLLDLGVAGYPTIIVTREAIGTARIAPGRVALRLDSTVETAVTVPGLASCTKNDDCPDGKTCQTDLTCK